MAKFIPRNSSFSAALGILVGLCGGFLVGLWYSESKDITGALGGVIGGIIGALGAAIAVHLTFEEQRRVQKDVNQALIKALWNDACCLQDLSYREARWWERELQDHRFGATEERLFDHLESVVLESNLHRIGDIPDRAADALLAMRSAITVVRSAHRTFYAMEDKIIEHVASKKLSQEEGYRRLHVNKMATFRGLCRVSVAARLAAHLLDTDQAYQKEREATFSPEEWKKRGPEIEEMNEFADQILERRRTGEDI